MNISPQLLEQLYSQGLCMDVVFILQLIDKEAIVVEECSSITIGFIQKCLRKQLITEDMKLTIKGKELIESMNTGQEYKAKKKEKSKFDEWWEYYRPTDAIFQFDKTGNINDKSIVFKGTRSLRTKKEDCKSKFNRIIDEGVYTADDLIEALKYEIILKVQASFQKKENKLSFMQNSLTYLNQRTFENFVELSKIDKSQKINVTSSEFEI